MSDLKDWIKNHEGFSSHPYKDTQGRVTIGWGHNLDELGITHAAANFIFDIDFNQAVKDLSQYSWYETQPDNVKDALVDMCFNMGIGRLLSFKKMIWSLGVKDYTRAALEVLDSKWASQVKERAKDVALMMRQDHGT